MSVLIKGMDEIPEDGAVLVVRHDDDGKTYIKYAGLMGYHMELVELPEKHGRLIDADALADDLEYDAQHFDDDHELKFNAAMWLRSNQNKVIVEAEYEE